MTEDELKTTGFDGETDRLLPDGWSEGDDFFADPATWSGAASQPDEDEDALGQVGTDETETGTEDALTMGETEDPDGRSAEPETEEPASGQTEEPISSPRILKLKVNHGKQDREVDINSMSDDELLERFQKAEAYDVMREKQMKEQYRQVYQDQIDAGMTEAAARMIAASECGGKSYPLSDDPAKEADRSVSDEPVKRDFVQEVQQLKALYPDFKETPDEVALAVAEGTDLLTAYVAYREKQTQQAAASLKKENEVLKHNAASAAKAPVRGVTGGGKTDTKPTDPFLKGLLDEGW